MLMWLKVVSYGWGEIFRKSSSRAGGRALNTPSRQVEEVKTMMKTDLQHSTCCRVLILCENHYSPAVRQLGNGLSQR